MVPSLCWTSRVLITMSVRTARPGHISHITDVMKVFLDDLTFYWPPGRLQRPSAGEEGKEIPGFSKTRVYFAKFIMKKLSALQKWWTKHEGICRENGRRAWLAFPPWGFTARLWRLTWSTVLEYEHRGTIPDTCLLQKEDSVQDNSIEITKSYINILRSLLNI